MAMDITKEKDGGVVKEIIKEGTGTEFPLVGDKVTVHYVGTLLEGGSQFDSSRDRGQKFEFTLGKGEVIKAWDLGVATMKIGEICKLTCKSEYAYGSRGSPPKIPPNATLVFEVELFGWTGEDLTSPKDGGIIRRTLVKGEGYGNPNDRALVIVSLVGRMNGSVFDEREVQFSLGEGCEYNIPDGIEKALERFKKNEKSIIQLKSKYGFGSIGNSALGIPPNADLDYEVHLKDFTKAKETWEMDQKEKLEQALLCKDRGTYFYSKQNYSQAVKFYKKITDYLQYDSGLSEEDKNESHSTLLAGHLNLSLCYLKLKDFHLAKDHATKAIELDKNNVKAYFRRGQAFQNIEYIEEAKEDFAKCLALDTTNKAAAQHLQICTTKIKEYKSKERRLYGGMFDKFAMLDAKKNPNHLNSDVMSGHLGEWDNTKEQRIPYDDITKGMTAEDVQNLNNVQMY